VHVALALAAKAGFSGIPEGAGPVGDETERGALAAGGEGRRRKAEIGNSESRRLTAQILIEPDDFHRVSPLDPQGGVGLTVDRPAAPEEAVRGWR